MTCLAAGGLVIVAPWWFGPLGFLAVPTAIAWIGFDALGWKQAAAPIGYVVGLATGAFAAVALVLGVAVIGELVGPGPSRRTFVSLATALLAIGPALALGPAYQRVERGTGALQPFWHGTISGVAGIYALGWLALVLAIAQA